ncbi:MAG: hypothetical protein AUJ75_01395 [Candidatus Omnitrophica bacterium CG1_02_49_10]|nr:MAG: hypothetical protein AUJ75_01395 [Candidatus Omnitrophica bacterium CG1_02_49_10]
MIKNITRAMRLPFITASVFPFIFGSLIAKGSLDPLTFLLGLIAASSSHLSANLINDYADSKTGADWKDKTFFGFFGGSKLIQEGELSERFYLKLSLFFAALASASVIALAFILKSVLIIFLFVFIIILSWQYSQPPLRLCYRRLGEIFIFMLFGPAAVMGGYFIQTGVFPHRPSLLLSLPFGFFITNILFANEVPDYPQDKEAGKFTWVSITGPEKAYILYIIIMAASFTSIGINIYLGYISPLAALSFPLIIPVIKAVSILKKSYNDKNRLVMSSKLTIAVHNIASIICIAAILLG